MSAIDQTPCPLCGAYELAIELRMTANPIGSFSISGSTPKFTARVTPWLTCSGCGAETAGRADPDGDHATFDPAQVTRGACGGPGGSG